MVFKERPAPSSTGNTFGTIDSTVLGFVRHERLAWDAHWNGVHAYHAWAFERRDGGVYVLTEETQNGWLARLGAREEDARLTQRFCKQV